MALLPSSFVIFICNRRFLGLRYRYMVTYRHMVTVRHICCRQRSRDRLTEMRQQNSEMTIKVPLKLTSETHETLSSLVTCFILWHDICWLSRLLFSLFLSRVTTINTSLYVSHLKRPRQFSRCYTLCYLLAYIQLSDTLLLAGFRSYALR